MKQSLIPRRPNDFRFIVQSERPAMTWTTPTLIEISVCLEINGYLPAEL